MSENREYSNIGNVPKDIHAVRRGLRSMQIGLEHVRQNATPENVTNQEIDRLRDILNGVFSLYTELNAGWLALNISRREVQT